MNTEYYIPVIALIGTIFGGAGLELIKRWLGKAKEEDDTATALRKELRDELRALRQEMNDVEKQVTEWKDRYYEVMEKKMRVEQDLMALKAQIRAGSHE